MDFEQIIKRLDWLEKLQRENKDSLAVLSDALKFLRNLGQCRFQADQTPEQTGYRTRTCNQTRGPV